MRWNVVGSDVRMGGVGRVLSSLAFQSPEDVAETLALVREAGITIVSLPLVNEW